MATPARILVTAFAPFGGRAQNASLLTLRGLKHALPWLRTRVLPVDARLAPARLRRALRELRPAALLMLGEAGGSREIRLETTAWNELDFRIPDAAGRQPHGLAIRPDAPSSLRSTLPFEQLLTPLLAAAHPVVLSADPGRYLCNQVLFEALHLLRDIDPACLAGFIHLPLESDYPTSRAIDALTRLLEETRILLAPPGRGTRVV
jgi:pyroglutamyl-peptidase